jgi:probable blue pigment (indigoidine) exporter
MKTSIQPNGLLVAATLLAPITWGMTYVTVTEMLPAGRPLLVAATRVLPAGLVLLLVGSRSSSWFPRRNEWLRIGTLAVFNFALFFPLLVVAVYRLAGGVAAAVGGLQPLLVALMTWAISGRRPAARNVVVGCVAAIGVGMVVIRPGAAFDSVGVIAAIGANVSFSIGVVLTKHFPPTSNRIASTGWQLVLSAAVLAPVALVNEGAVPPLTGRNLIGFAYLSIVGTALAFVLWFRGVRRLPTAAPPLLGLAAPITGATLGWIVLDQSLSPVQLAGFALTIAAIAYGAVLGAHRSTRLSTSTRMAVAAARVDSKQRGPRHGSMRA